MYTGGLNGYFNEFKLKVDSCDVNPSKVGTYTITYKYTDPKLDVEKTVKRTVYVESANKDVISFGVEINGGTPIVRGTRPDVIPTSIRAKLSQRMRRSTEQKRTQTVLYRSLKRRDIKSFQMNTN